MVFAIYAIPTGIDEVSASIFLFYLQISNVASHIGSRNKNLWPILDVIKSMIDLFKGLFLFLIQIENNYNLRYFYLMTTVVSSIKLS